jgi:hypothetical protein
MATRDNPPFIDEIGACALAWYDGAVNYTDTVNGSALFPATADGDHATIPLSGPGAVWDRRKQSMTSTARLYGKKSQTEQLAHRLISTELTLFVF